MLAMRAFPVDDLTKQVCAAFNALTLPGEACARAVAKSGALQELTAAMRSDIADAVAVEQACAAASLRCMTEAGVSAPTAPVRRQTDYLASVACQWSSLLSSFDRRVVASESASNWRLQVADACPASMSTQQPELLGQCAAIPALPALAVLRKHGSSVGVVRTACGALQRLLAVES